MPIETITLGQFLNKPDLMRSQLNKLAPASTYQFFYDFTEQSLVEADSPFILNAGSDDLAVDPAINDQPGGVIRLTAGDGDGTVAADGSQIVLHVPVQASLGGLAFECRLKITDVSECSCYVGLTDVTTLEEPMSVSGTTLTTTATDAVGFVYDTAMTTDEWWMAGVHTDDDAEGSGTTGIAPADATYQVLRCEIAADGQSAEFFINEASVGSLTADVCEPDTDLFFTVVANGNGSNAAAATVDIDYILVEHSR